jgi:hypothetical protein
MDERNHVAELDRERNDLVKAEKDLIEGAQRVEQQQELITKLTVQGHDTEQAKTLLHNLQAMMVSWRDHRDLIVQRIGILESLK